MAITLWKVRDTYNSPNHKEYIIDSSADTANLPTSISAGTGAYTNLNACDIGSIAIIPNGDIYILNNSNSWVVL